MTDLHKHSIKLSAGQKQKLRIAFKKRKSTIIGLKSDQLVRGCDQILLTTEQHKAVQRAIKKGTGIRLNMNFEQLLKNKDGGLLKEMLGIVEKVPLVGNAIISPLVRKKIAPLLRNQFIPWLKRLVDDELDSIIDKDPKGAGLKRRINRKLNSIFFKAGNKKRPSNRYRLMK